MEETETALETLQSLTRRSVYVVRTVFQQWRNHRRRLSEESFDLDWDDLESIWADSREMDWSEPSVKSVTAPTGAKSVDSSIIVSHRHRLLNLTDTGHWAREIEADPPDWQERRGSISFHIRELRSVPLSELFLNFPAATVHMKPLDVAKLCSYVIAGLSVLHIS